MTLFNFEKDKNISNWFVLDDGVMGGMSQGEFLLNEEGHGVFRGKVSLENYGGFSSVRYRFDLLDISEFSKIKIHCKGDGKRYQFRSKIDQSDRHSYMTHFETSGDWEVIEISFKDMVPTFRGQRLDMPNFPGKNMEEIAFLIGNKKAESFELQIDKMEFFQ